MTNDTGNTVLTRWRGIALDPLQQEPNRHPTEFMGGLTNSRDGRRYQGVKVDVVKGHERDIFSNFNIYFAKRLDKPNRG